MLSDDGLVDLPSDGDSNRWTKQLLAWGVETRDLDPGIVPAPIEQRNDPHFSKIFFIWLSANCNILTFSAGTLGPVVYGLGLRDSCLIILFFNLLFCAPPAYLATWGPKLGLRQMVQARYSFGYYGVIIPCVFNLVAMIGFSILNCILGGQALASVANGRLSWSVGIIVIALIGLLVSFCGYKVLNLYNRFVWVPTAFVILFIIGIGIRDKRFLNENSITSAPASAVLSFASTIGGFVIGFSALSSDFTIYLDHRVSSLKLFLYSYTGLLLPLITFQSVGAAVAIASSSISSWETGYQNGNVGGLLEAVLQPIGKLGKVFTVLLSLSVTANMASTFYSISLNVQIFIPLLVGVPRYMFSIVAAAIVAPLAIVGSHKFYATLSDFLGLIGYWSTAFASIVLTEHLVFRKRDFTAYHMEQWDKPRLLPTGIAALAAGVAACTVVVPSIDQTWFVGPFAKKVGNIGLEVAFLVTAILYVPFRALEIRFRKRV